MSAALPRPSVSSRAGSTGRTSARGKPALASQRKSEREKLLAVVARSREPASDKAHAHQHRAAPATAAPATAAPVTAAPVTPSSVARASRLSHRSAEKLKQQPVIASVSSVYVTTPLPELPSIPERVVNGCDGDGIGKGGRDGNWIGKGG